MEENKFRPIHFRGVVQIRDFCENHRKMADSLSFCNRTNRLYLFLWHWKTMVWIQFPCESHRRMVGSCSGHKHTSDTLFLLPIPPHRVLSGQFLVPFFWNLLIKLWLCCIPVPCNNLTWFLVYANRLIEKIRLIRCYKNRFSQLLPVSQFGKSVVISGKKEWFQGHLPFQLLSFPFQFSYTWSYNN